MGGRRVLGLSLSLSVLFTLAVFIVVVVVGSTSYPPSTDTNTIEEQCLQSGGSFKVLPDPHERGKQKVYLKGANWFDLRNLFTKVILHPTPIQKAKDNFSLLILEGFINQTQYANLKADTSIVQSVMSFFTGADDEKHRQGITSPFGDQTLVLFGIMAPVEIDCKRETDWVVVGMVCAGFFLSTMSGILGAYQATLLICGAILGMLIGIAVPLFFFFNKQTKVFITAASAGLVSYGAVFCWHWLVGSTYFWMYLCVSAIFGMWWFGTNASGGSKQVVSWSLWLLGMVLLGTATSHFTTINATLLGVAFVCRICIESGLARIIFSYYAKQFYWHVWLKIFPKYKTMLNNVQYEQEAQVATREAMDQLRLYYFKYDDWRSLYKDSPETIKRIETFLGNKDHIQVNLDGAKKDN